MSELSGQHSGVQEMSKEQTQKWSQELLVILRHAVEKEATYVEGHVNQVRRQYPNISDEGLAKRIVSSGSLKAGGIGAICGLGGLITLPITMPVNTYLSFRIQAQMILSIAHVYGWDIHDEDAITDILLVMTGNAGADPFREAGIQTDQAFTKKVVNKLLARKAVKKINKVLSRRIIAKVAETSITSFAKLVPVVGAPIGAAFDYFGTLAVGRTALAFYKR